MALPAMLSVGLLAWSAIANLGLGERGYVPRNLVLTALLLVLASRLGQGRNELGLSRATAGSGLVWGGAAGAVVAVAVGLGVVLGEVVPPLRALLDDARADLGAAALAHAVLVRIPLGTALFEEVAFRGVLFAAFERATSTGRAVVWSSAVFGLWHVPPTIVTLRINGIEPGSGEGVAAIVGGVLITTVGGLLFALLRVRSGSLLAPMLAHWATNGFGLLGAAVTRWVGRDTLG